ncbi:MAG: acetylornithine/succinylornithine family transaminase [Candidatus Omnitrophica bacterium]|nr:acetylornithine/succinylornithine family transaminase [Candidatus Omnitrophota bacterium]
MNTRELLAEYTLPTYRRYGPVFVKGKGSWLWDEHGEQYLDLFPGWGVSILGHCHPRISAAVCEQAQKLIHLPNNLYQHEQAVLARDLVKCAFPSKVFFGNSGAEAIEGAIKFSRLYGKGTRYEIITMSNSFHGRTAGALAATGQKKYQTPFKPLLPGFREVPFNDYPALERACTDTTVAVLLEPIQGEGGVNIADEEYLRQVAQFCARHDLLLIVDEVQTGMGRTGRMFCYEHYGITPDLMTLSKGLGAGLPISALLVKDTIADLMQPGTHASTFGGSPLVTRAAREALRIIKDENLRERAQTMGDFLCGALHKLQKDSPRIIAVRGKGLMTAVELSADAAPVFQECLKRKVIVNATHGNVLRIMPALTVTREEIEQGVEVISESLKNGGTE